MLGVEIGGEIGKFIEVLGVISLAKEVWRLLYLWKGRKWASFITIFIYLSIMLLLFKYDNLVFQSGKTIFAFLKISLPSRVVSAMVTFYYLFGVFMFMSAIAVSWKLSQSPTISGKITSIKRIEKALAGGKGEPFKIGWLNAKDIQFTVRRKEVDKLKELFKDHSAILLEGPSASGKTVIAKRFGLEMAKKGYFVYYANLTVRRGLGKDVRPEELPQRLEKELEGLDADIYLIIEDVHNYIEPYEKMNWVVENGRIKLLLVSRPLREFEFSKKRELVKKEARKFDWTHKFEIDPEDAVPQIIRHAVKHEGLKLFDEERLYDVKEFVRGNLYILVFAILAAKEKGKPLHEITDGDITKQVDDYIRGRRMPQFKSLHEKVAESLSKEELNPDEERKLDDMLKFIALTSQLELPLGEELIAELVKVKSDEVRRFMRPLRKSGDIVELREGNRRSYIIPHARLAELMSKALVESEDEKLDFFLTYIKEGDYPGTLMWRMHWNDKIEFEKLVEKLRSNDFRDMPVDRVDIIETASALHSLDRSNRKTFLDIHNAEILSKKLKDVSLQNIKWFLLDIAEVNKELAKKVAQKHGEEISESLKDAPFEDIKKFLYDFAEVCRELARYLYQNHKEEISKSLNETSLLIIGEFLSNLARLDIELARSIAQNHRKEISNLLNGASLLDIGRFLSRIAWTDKNLAKEIVRTNKERISKLLKKVSLSDTGKFLSDIARASGELSRSIAQIYQEEISNLLKDASLSDISGFLSHIAWTDRGLARSIAQRHREGISNLLKCVSLSDIGDFLSHIAKADGKLSKAIAKNLSNEISKSIEDAPLSEPSDIEKFLSNIEKILLSIARADKGVARSIAQRHAEEILLKFFKNVSLLYIGIFLSYIAKLDRRLARSIVKSHKKEISKLLDEASLLDIGGFLSSIALFDKKLADEVTQTYRDEILLKSPTNKWLLKTGEFLCDIAWTDRKLAGEVVQKHRMKIDEKLKNSNWDNWLEFWLIVACGSYNFAFKTATDFFADTTTEKIEQASHEKILDLIQPIKFFKKISLWWPLFVRKPLFMWQPTNKAKSRIRSFARRLICHYKDIIIQKFGSVEAMPDELVQAIKNCTQPPNPLKTDA